MQGDNEVEDRPIFLPGQFKAGKIGLSPSSYNVRACLCVRRAAQVLTDALTRCRQLIVKVLRSHPSERTERDLHAFQPLHGVPQVRSLRGTHRGCR